MEVIELVQSGYNVVISTHSTTFLEFVWAFNNLQSLADDEFKTAMCEMFDINARTTAAALFDKFKEKTIKTFYSGKRDSDGRVVFADVSTLDAFSDDVAVSEWGGLSSFAGKSSEIVSRYGK